jgi:Na+/melibiose symporter-like transporter
MHILGTAYLGAHFGKCLMWHASVVLFAFFLTETCHLTPAATGVLLASTLALNGVLDLLLGRWQHARLGSAMDAARFQAVGAAIAAAFFALFCASSLVPEGIRPAWALTTLIGFRCVYPLVDVAQNALIVLGSNTLTEREEITVRRIFFSALAHVTVCLGVAPLLLHLSKHSGAEFALAGIVIALIVLVSAMRLGRCRAEASATLPPSWPDRRSNAAPELRLRFSSIIVLTVVVGFLVAGFRKLEPYISAYAQAPGTAVNLSAAVALGVLLVQPLWRVLLRSLGERGVFAVAGGALLCAGVLLHNLAGGGTYVTYAAGLLSGIGFSGVGTALWLGAAAKTSKRTATMDYGALTCASKTAQAAGTLAVCLFLEQSDYRSALAVPDSTAALLIPAIPLTVGLLCAAASIPRLRGQQIAEQQRSRPYWRRRLRRQAGST